MTSADPQESCGRALWSSSPSDDRHQRAARRLVQHLGLLFPRAGIAVTGSVAKGTHRPQSDLDLVVVDPSFERDMQIATEAEGVSTAIICLRPHLDPKREQIWMLSSGGDARLVSMVRSARIVWDPESVFQVLQQTIARLDRERSALRAELLSLHRERASALIEALERAPRREPLLLRLMGTIIDGWCVSEGLLDDSKETARLIFEQITESDPHLGRLLHAAVPVTAVSAGILLQAAEHVFRLKRDEMK